MTNIQIEEILFKFISVILQCENLIGKEYNLKGIPYLNKDKIPKTGKIQGVEAQLEYRFHGSGCTFNLGSIELDYSIYIDRENYITISPWGFSCFVNTYTKIEIPYTEAQVLEWLEMLNAQKLISKIQEGYFVYEVSFEWYKAVKISRNW